MHADPQLELEKAGKLRDFYVKDISLYGAFLFCLFGFVDYFFNPNHYISLLYLRLLSAVVIMGCRFVIVRFDVRELRTLEHFVALASATCALTLFFMTYIINDLGSVYWAGLVMLVSVHGVLPSMSFRYCILLILILVLPFTVFSIASLISTGDFRHLLGPIFLNGTTFLALVGKWNIDELESKEFLARKQLQHEIENRNVIIKAKTEEALRLRTLSKQFSPQIVQGIESGAIQIDGTIERKDICAIFIDIKDSTKKVTELEPAKLEAILSMYLRDVVEVMLRNDMTIDKFLGDGVFGFTNSPIHQEDYVERAICVALQIEEHFAQQREKYESLWEGPFEYRIGIATGIASIGFYGDDKFMRAYTAIGKVINLASRLNSVSGTNEISVSGDVITALQERNSPLLASLVTTKREEQSLKGFESTKIDVWRIASK